jgi:hypothetical protein
LSVLAQLRDKKGCVIPFRVLRKCFYASSLYETENRLALARPQEIPRRPELSAGPGSLTNGFDTSTSNQLASGYQGESNKT